MALGIGVTTAIFSVCDALLWKPVPLPHLETLVTVMQGSPEDLNHWDSATPADIDDIRRENTTLASLASWEGGLANLAASRGEPDRVIQSLVSANFFDVVGIQPVLGRAFRPGEDVAGREHEVLLSDGLWRRRFASDPGIVGQSIRLDDEPYTVIGVMPASYDFPLASEIWTPMVLTPLQRTTRRAQMLQSVARLKPGRTVEQAAAEVSSIGARLEKLYPDSNKNRRFVTWPALKFVVGYETHQYLIMLLGSVAFVLLIACANVANRALGREDDAEWDAARDPPLYSGLERHAAGQSRAAVHAGGGDIERHSRGIVTGLAVLPAEPHVCAPGRRQKLVRRKSAATAA
jgi:hypothetical protein